jgi:hypothetical protein
LWQIISCPDKRKTILSVFYQKWGCFALKEDLIYKLVFLQRYIAVSSWLERQTRAQPVYPGITCNPERE